MHKGKFYIDGRQVKFKSLSASDYTYRLGSWSAELDGFDEEITGLQEVEVYDDRTQILKGRLLQPKETVGKTVSMSLSGPEWTDILRDDLTGYNQMRTVNLATALPTILENSRVSLGDYDPLTVSQADPTVYDTTLEFLNFTFTETCIVYDTEIEVQDETTAGTFEFPSAAKRGVFHSQASGYFYFVAYDFDASLLKYNSTQDFVAWKGWTSLGADIGAGGNYGIWWDEDNGRLFLLAEDLGGNVDFYRYSEAGGTLTQQDFDDNVDAGSLVTGPVMDSQGDIFWICDDGVNYVLWEFVYSGSSWNNRASWAKADNDDPRLILRTDDTANPNDMIVIIMDDDANEWEEWLWDDSLSSFSFVRKIGDIASGFGVVVAGYQDSHGNMFLAMEHYISADTDAEIYLTFRYAGETSWETPLKLVDDDDYQDIYLLSLTGDEAGNLYFFYINNDGATQTLNMIKLTGKGFLGWEEVTLSTAVDDTSRIMSPAGGTLSTANQALFILWLDDGDDPNAALFSPEAIGNFRQYRVPDEVHDYEYGLDFDGTATSGGSLASSTLWASSGRKSIEAKLTGDPTSWQTAGGYYDSLNYSKISIRAQINFTQIGLVDDGDDLIFLALAGTDTLAYVGLGLTGGAHKWFLVVRNGASWVRTWGSTVDVQELVGTDHTFELEWENHATLGYAKLFVDDAVDAQDLANDTADYGNAIRVDMGLYGDQCQNPSTAYFDAFIISDNHIGAPETGNFLTDTYTASGGFVKWGTLDSTDDDDYDTGWEIQNGGIILLLGLTTPVDLDERGLSSAVTTIEIKAYLRDTLALEDLTGSQERNYVYDVRISERTGYVDLDTDFEHCSDAARKLADILDYEYKVDPDDDTLEFVEELGEDLTDVVVLKTAHSVSTLPDIKPNITVVGISYDWDQFANAIFLKGAGDYPDRIEATAKNQDSIDEYGPVWDEITNKDCVTEGMAQTAAQTEVDARSSPIRSIKVEVNRADFDPGLIARGNWVRLIAREIGVDESVRVRGVSVSYSKAGRTLSVEVVDRPQSVSYMRRLKKIDSLERWI